MRELADNSKNGRKKGTELEQHDTVKHQRNNVKWKNIVRPKNDLEYATYNDQTAFHRANVRHPNDNNEEHHIRKGIGHI